jgi:glycerophosphoryl diester phosphodiesterase
VIPASPPARFAYLDAPTPLAFAHRGGAGDPGAGAAENTAAAFARCVALGYRYIETDTHATADGVPVIFHDADLRRMAGRPEPVHALRWADLATIRIGGAAAVPRLDEVLAGWPGLRFNIDVKADPAVEPTVAAVRRAGATDRVLLAAFADARLARIRALVGPAVATGMGQRAVARLWASSRLRGAYRPGVAPPHSAHRAAAAQVPHRFGRLRVVDRRFVEHAHRLGLQVHVWTIVEPAEMRELLDLGVDGIMTDHIDVLKGVYTERGLWHDGASSGPTSEDRGPA